MKRRTLPATPVLNSIFYIGTAVVFAGFFISGSALLLSTWFPLAAAWAILRRALLPSLGRVIFLRKFHHETPPNYPLSRVIEKIDSCGYEVITLADSVVSRKGMRPFAWIIAACVAWCASMTFVIMPFLILLALSAVALAATTFAGSLIPYLRIQSPIFSAFLFIVICGFLVLAWVAPFAAPVFWCYKKRPWRRDNYMRWGNQAFEFILKRMPGGVLDWTHKSQQSIFRAVRKSIRSTLSTGFVVIRCADHNWNVAVTELVQSSDIVCVDISNPSKHIQTEIGVLALRPPKRIIWLRQENSASHFSYLDNTSYSIFDNTFQRPLREVVYPDDPSGSMYSRTAQTLLSLDAQRDLLIDLIQRTDEEWAHKPEVDQE